jgi:hypothetical protein
MPETPSPKPTQPTPTPLLPPPTSPVDKTGVLTWTEQMAKPPAYKNVNAQVARLWPRPTLPAPPAAASAKSPSTENDAGMCAIL